MKAKLYMAAFVAVLVSIVAMSPKALAAPVQTISSGGDFAVASVVEVPGTYPPTVYLYGGSSRGGFAYTEFGVLTSTDGFTTNPTWQAMTGVVGYASAQVNNAIVTCPAGKTCGGYKAFYIIDTSPATLYRCTGLAGVKALSGCSSWSVSGILDYSRGGIGLDQTGDKLLVGALNDNGGLPDDTKSQIHSIDIATSAATKLTNCSDPTKDSTPNGSIAGDGVNQYFYLNYDNADHYRYTWNGSTCTGGRTKVVAAMGWDNAVNDVADTDDYGAVGQLTGTFYLSWSDGTFKISKKDSSCGDSFISLSSAEKCDPNNLLHPLNDQVCTSIGMGFTGGTLNCNAGTCGWDTSSCTSPAVCGNGTKEGAEVCDFPDFGGKTCATQMGLGYTGPLTCTACTTIGTGSCVPPAPVCGNNVKEGSEVCDAPDFGGKTCATQMGIGYTGPLTCTACTTIGTGSCVPPAPTCGDMSCNGGETCSSCPGDCGVCCGNGNLDAGEQCDGSKLGGGTCSSVLGGSYSGSLSCKSNCTYNTAACTPPVTCGNGLLDAGEQCDGSDLGGKTCASEMGEGWSGTPSCNSCMVETSACSFDWGVKVLSGGCKVVGSDLLNAAIQTVNGTCQFSFTPKEGAKANNFEVTAKSVVTIPFTVAKLPAKSAFNIPQGVIWKPADSNGNEMLFHYGTGAGVLMGDEGTVYGFDTLTEYPVVSFGETAGKICFARDMYDEKHMFSEINVGNGVGCLAPGYGVKINVETKTVVSGPSNGTGGDGGAGGDTGTGGNDTGTGPTGGDGGDGGGCSCAVPGKDGFNSYLILAMALTAMAALRRRKS